MNIREQIEKDFVKAYLSKDKDKVAVLGMLKSAFSNAEIARKREALGKEDVENIIKREVKQRKEGLLEWEKAGRKEEADNEREAIKILEKYLPAMLSEEEIEAEARKTITELKAASLQDMGKVMGGLMPKLKGRADGKLTRKIVEKLLRD